MVHRHRLVTIPMSPDDAVSELNEIKNIAKINCYPEHFVDRIHTKRLKKNELQRLTTLIPVSKDRTKDTPSLSTHASQTSYKRFSANTTSI
jgi:hypothetical protein